MIHSFQYPLQDILLRILVSVFRKVLFFGYIFLCGFYFLHKIIQSFVHPSFQCCHGQRLVNHLLSKQCSATMVGLLSWTILLTTFPFAAFFLLWITFPVDSWIFLTPDIIPYLAAVLPRAHFLHGFPCSLQRLVQNPGRIRLLSRGRGTSGSQSCTGLLLIMPGSLKSPKAARVSCGSNFFPGKECK